MHFDVTPAQRALAGQARAYAREVLAAGVAERDLRKRIPASVFSDLGQLGLLGVNVPRELGGREQGVVAYAMALREIAEVDPAVAVTTSVTNMVAEVIAAFGSKQQRTEHVPKIAQGEYYGGAFALSEPGAGSDAGSLTTRGERRGDSWLLNGEKMWITTGDDAGVSVVWARTGEPGPKGLSCFLVPKGTRGLVPGRPEEKMGLRASHTVSLSLCDVELPSDALLGKEGGGFPIAMVALDGGRIGIAVQSVGLGFAALAAARAHVHQLGPAAQVAQFRLADAATELEAAWLMALRAAFLKEQGKRRHSAEAAMAKAFASEAANRAVRMVLELAGSRGLDPDGMLARLFCDCRVTQIYEGTSEIQRLVIARQLLSTPR